MNQRKLLELEFCKVRNQIQTLEGNEYSSPSLKTYQDKIFELYEVVQNDFSNGGADYYNFGNILSLISESVQFLEDSTLNLIPFETVWCLEKVLKEWNDFNSILVTTFKRNKYAFDPTLSINSSVIFQVIKYTYDVDFENTLLQISIPKHEVNDYFFSIVLYHELGHYIDLKYKITETLVNQEFFDLSPNEKKKKENHLREYFADIFSAQYVSDTFINFLEVRASEDGESSTHPATSERIELIEDFIDGNDNDLLSKLKTATFESTGKDLCIRFEDLKSKDDFFEYMPPIIENDKQLHGLLIAGWDVWIEGKDKFKEDEPFKVYTFLNNLIEKSISNYMFFSLWEEAKKASNVSE